MISLRRRPPGAAPGFSGFVLATLALLFGAGAGQAAAAPPAAPDQPVERHLPTPEAPTAPVIVAPAEPGTINDDRALGAPLKTLILLGPTDQIQAGTGAAAGVEVNDLPRLDQAASRAALARFLGKPISRKLISQVEIAVVRRYRKLGYPFVEVSTPEQEIDQGVLQVRVVEFHIGKIEVKGASPGETRHIERQLRIAPGDTIDSPRLIEDFDWLSRYPFRTVTPAFTPGTNLGETDLDLAVTNAKPWQVSAGYSNSGSALTGWDRYFLAATVGAPILNDSVLSMQVTGSPDFWAVRGKVFSDRHPQYESAAALLTVPTAPRQDVELTVNAVQSDEAVSPFEIRQQTLEATLAYRSAVSDWLPAPGEVSVGVEAARQMRSTYFGPFEVLFGVVNVFQLYGDWTDRWSDPFGHSVLDLSVHGSPGNIDRSNSTGDIEFYTDGRVTSATYVYGAASLTRTSKLPAGFSLLTEWNGQYAGRAIPDPEQIAVGGQGAVRGYTLDDGAFDDGLVLRNTLEAPAVPIVGRGELAFVLSPMSYVDYGLGRSEALRQDINFASVGVGADARLGPHLSGNVSVSYPLLDAHVTRQGDWRLDARISFAY